MDNKTNVKISWNYIFWYFNNISNTYCIINSCLAGNLDRRRESVLGYPIYFDPSLHKLKKVLDE